MVIRAIETPNGRQWTINCDDNEMVEIVGSIIHSNQVRNGIPDKLAIHMTGMILSFIEQVEPGPTVKEAIDKVGNPLVRGYLTEMHGVAHKA